MNYGKRKTVYFVGGANAGKSTLQDIICCPYEYYERGSFDVQGSTSTFWFQRLIDKAVYIGEEIMAEQKSVQTLKKIMEGNMTLDTDAAYRDWETS